MQHQPDKCVRAAPDLEHVRSRGPQANMQVDHLDACDRQECPRSHQVQQECKFGAALPLLQLAFDVLQVSKNHEAVIESRQQQWRKLKTNGEAIQSHSKISPDQHSRIPSSR